MSGLIHSLDVAVTASRKTRSRRDTSEACRERASADLLKSVSMLTANERQALQRSAHSWSLRADMLDGIERSAADKRV